MKENIFLRCGVCDEYILDNSSDFDNKDVTKLLDEYGSSHTLIPPEHARANTVEKANRVIKTVTEWSPLKPSKYPILYFGLRYVWIANGVGISELGELGMVMVRKRAGSRITVCEYRDT